MLENRLDIANQLRLEHEAVHELVGQVEQLIKRPDPSVIGPGWSGSLTRSLESLHSHLKNHFAFEELGGFMEEVMMANPGATVVIEELRQDHQRFLAALGRLSGLARGCTVTAEPSIASLCAAVSQFLADLRRHEDQENHLVQTTFLDDLGMVD
jgi:iron-sulfur cluster repair protein YtfE (RIC family)